MPCESDFLDWIRSQQTTGDLVRIAAGDDLAVLNWPARDLLIVGVDQVLDGVHFDSRIHSPRHIGRKVMNRNLSDCAAMGCLPAAALASVALPRGVGMEYAKELYLGLRDAADPFDCALIGGDTASWDQKLALSVTILGRSGGVEPITRSGAEVGNGIYVTGALGGSILGRHMSFEPRIAWGRELAASGKVTAMIDLSDGLSRDLPRICALSRVGAIVEAPRIPIHDDAIELSKRDGRSPLDHALHDGEDHELLFTSPADWSGRWPRIGKIVAEPGLWIEANGARQPIEPRGWDHSL
jgi:thiamine-monophosphate kinase